MCLTATANQAVVNDSIRIMKLSKNVFKHTQSFNRPNLIYSIRKKVNDKKTIEDLADIIRSRKNQSGIIYCFSRKDCETVAEKLQLQMSEMHGKIDFYHADIPTEERNRKQNLWSKGEIKVLWYVMIIA